MLNNKNLTMTGVEPQTSGIGSNRSANWATTTAQLKKVFELLQQSVANYFQSTRSFQLSWDCLQNIV